MLEWLEAIISLITTPLSLFALLQAADNNNKAPKNTKLLHIWFLSDVNKPFFLKIRQLNKNFFSIFYQLLKYIYKIADMLIPIFVKAKKQINGYRS
jgi:hypothetical protein